MSVFSAYILFFYGIFPVSPFFVYATVWVPLRCSGVVDVVVAVLPSHLFPRPFAARLSYGRKACDMILLFRPLFHSRTYFFFYFWSIELVGDSSIDTEYVTYLFVPPHHVLYILNTYLNNPVIH